MSDSIGSGRFNLPDYDQFEDESFPPLPPPLSPGLGGDDPFGNGEEDGDLSKLADVPAAKRRTVKRPQPKLDSQRLTSERGLPALRTLFGNVRFKGKGHEAEDLRVVMQKMENWAHRLYPKLQFDDFMDKVERLGSKKDVQTCLKRIRLDMPLVHEDFIGETEVTPVQHVFEDPEPFGSTGRFPLGSQGPAHSTPAHTTPAPTTPAPTLTEEQQRRIELNRQLALERRLARRQPPTDQPDSQADSQAAVSAQTDSSQATSAQAASSQATSAQAASSQAASSQATSAQAASSQATSAQAASSQATSAQAASSQATSAQAASSQAGVQASSVHLPPAISPPTEPCPLVPGFEERKDMEVGPSTEPPIDAELDPA
ncbi:TIMELESS-interacting protein isoform X1 [Gadus macrocephalus]|uniref:TIMELESS-interacting protein isoform X1 n=1 Tax=Gadus macrocephalus TaxID=80720 RepID=UPI0028CBBC95|nr:TIMELESS-interacting protein isoform X1 [Gadus macrocephalus]